MRRFPTELAPKVTERRPIRAEVTNSNVGLKLGSFERPLTAEVEIHPAVRAILGLGAEGLLEAGRQPSDVRQ